MQVAADYLVQLPPLMFGAIGPPIVWYDRPPRMYGAIWLPIVWRRCVIFAGRYHEQMSGTTRLPTMQGEE